MISPSRGTVRYMLVILYPTVPESVCSYFTSTFDCETHTVCDSLSYSSCLTVSVVTSHPHSSVRCARHMTGVFFYPTVPGSVSQCILLLDLHMAL